MTYKTTTLCEEDIIKIDIRGVADFGIDRAEVDHAGRSRTFARVLHDRQDWERHLRPLTSPS